ncbi:MAG TPA: alpha/beta fold hydrolase [Oculatellaceae cyanobacterium]
MRNIAENLTLGFLTAFGLPAPVLGAGTATLSDSGDISKNSIHVIASRRSRNKSGTYFSSQPYQILYAKAEEDHYRRWRRRDVILSIDADSDQFYNELSGELQRQKKSKFLVFVHGYNSNVKTTYRTASRLAKAMHMPVVVFAWHSKRNPLAYTPDECTAEWTSWQLARVLTDMAKRYDSANITLVGHSMGCRMICWALAQSSLESQAKFNRVLLCSPDIDSLIFEENMPLLAARSQQTTVFASTKDARLRLSKLVHGNGRMGLLPKRSKRGMQQAPLLAHNNGTAINTTSSRLLRRKCEPVRTYELTSAIKVVDYTSEDRSLFGHAVPYALLREPDEVKISQPENLRRCSPEPSAP